MAENKAIKYSIVIVSYNCKEDLTSCIQSIEAYSGQHYELIVVDNNSTDGTQDWLRTIPQCTPILNKKNEGFSRACNLGAAKASGEYLFFLNPDTRVSPGWLDRMNLYFKNPEVGAVGPVSNYVAGLQKYNLYTSDTLHSPSQIASFSASIAAKNNGQGVKTKLLIGFCLAIRTEVFAQMKGMDEALFLGNDDLDICWRLRRMGFLLIVATDVFVYHEGQKSFQTEPSTKVTRLVQESTDALYEKLVRHYGSVSAVPSPMELWNMDWFNPSTEIRERMKNYNPDSIQQAVTENVTENTMTDIPTFQVLIYAPPDTSFSLLESTLCSLPDTVQKNIIILNHSANPNLAPDNYKGLKLDLNRDMSESEVLKLGINLVQQEIVLFSFAGVSFSGFFKLAISQFIPASDYSCIPVTLKNTPDTDNILTHSSLVFFASKRWLSQAIKQIGTKSLFPSLSTLMVKPGKDDSNTNLALIYHGTLTDSTKNIREEPKFQSTVSEKDFAHYPESLHPHLQEASHPAFGSSNNLELFSPDGTILQPGDQDVLIFRFQKNSNDQVLSNLLHFRKNLPSLKKLVLLHVIAAEATMQNETTTSSAYQASITRIKQMVWAAGFAIHHTETYSGTQASPPKPNNTQGLRIKPDACAKNLDTKNPPSETGTQIVCHPRTEAYRLDKMVSIIILGYNQLDYTRQCISSIQKHTKQKFELILVDNGSQDDTAAYFNSIPDAKVVINEKNMGVSKGWNQALKRASGEYLLIFNNDTIVNPGWLENMVRLAESNSKIGIVGPRSNSISGPQLIPDTHIKTMEDISAFSQTWQEQHSLSAFEFDRVTGFCMLISRQAFNDIGYFDERFGKGNFEDDDYCLRARYMGYMLLVANDSFVFHFGSMSYRQESVDWQQLMRENEQKFRDKWSRGKSALQDTIVSSGDTPAPEDTKDNKVQQMVSQALQAYENGDLTEARNIYLKASELDTECPEIYNGLGILSFHENVYTDALMFFRKALELNPGDKDIALNIIDVLDKSCDPSEASQCLSALLVDFSDNQVFLDELQKHSGPSGNANIHWKSHVEDLIKEKGYNEALDLLEGVLNSGNDLAYCYNYLGIIAFECGDIEMAWEHFKKSLDINLLDEDVLINYCDAGIKLGKKSEVLGTFEKVFSYPGKTAAFREVKQSYDQLKQEAAEGSWNADKIITSREKNIMGENLIREGLMDKSHEVFQELLQEDPQNFRALNNLGLIAWYASDNDTAWGHFTRALTINPTYMDALINAFDAALKLNKINEFRPLLDKAMELEPHNRELLDILNTIKERGENIYEIKNYESIDPINALFDTGQIQLQEEKLNEATISFLDVIEDRPDWFAPFNGLGVIAYKKRMYREAYKLFEKAVELNPLDEDSLLNLWENAGLLSMETEVIDRLISAVQIDPNLQQVKAALDSYTT
ncbi:MAG: glycosyltransferase [Fibrobacteria bacterium]|nr:glycosyltransferase [Fibrobacteria bacterium]